MEGNSLKLKFFFNFWLYLNVFGLQMLLPKEKPLKKISLHPAPPRFGLILLKRLFSPAATTININYKD